METSTEPRTRAHRTQPVTVVIPTLGRERVLVETIEAVLRLEEPAAELLVVDQTPEHEPETESALKSWQDQGRLRWIRLERPSIPHAMNEGLRRSASPVVLFLDDDIVPVRGLVSAHARAHGAADVVAVTGMVLQPGQKPAPREELAPRGQGLRRDLEFPFWSEQPADVWNVMAGNLSVKRDAALECGGFDERFIGVAYRFETEFCRRLRRAGGTVRYEPTAAIEHLRAPSGGTRTWGFSKTSARGEHSVGDYYFALLEGRPAEVVGYLLYRILSECLSRFHRRRPWYIPVKALGELRGLVMACRLIKASRDGQSSGGEQK